MKKDVQKNLLRFILILCILGTISAVYLTYNHYASPDEGSFCDFGDTVSCSIVNTSKFSEIFNVPVAIFGLLWLSILFFMTVRAMNKGKEAFTALLLWSLAGLGFVIYFVIAEIILKAICSMCTLIHIIVLIVLGISVYLFMKNERKLTKKEIMIVVKAWAFVTIILMLLPILYFNIAVDNGQDYDAFAQCITDKEIQVYGSFWCGSCAKQRELFGDSFEHIIEIECHPQGENSQTELCLEKEIEGTPTWVLEPNGVEEDRHVGYMTIEKLEEFSGCKA